MGNWEMDEKMMMMMVKMMEKMMMMRNMMDEMGEMMRMIEEIIMKENEEMDEKKKMEMKIIKMIEEMMRMIEEIIMKENEEMDEKMMMMMMNMMDEMGEMMRMMDERREKEEINPDDISLLFSYGGEGEVPGCYLKYLKTRCNVWRDWRTNQPYQEIRNMIPTNYVLVGCHENFPKEKYGFLIIRTEEEYNEAVIRSDGDVDLYAF